MIKVIFKKIIFGLMSLSLHLSTSKRQKHLMQKIEEIVPDISDARTQYNVSGRWLNKAFRTLDARQIEFVLNTNNYNTITSIVDIGDSNGRHMQYLKGLSTSHLATLSVNLDQIAIDRILSKGLEAVCMDASKIAQCGYDTFDLGVCFETLEHLSDPIGFLKSLSISKTCRKLIITVPIVDKSRVCLNYIRKNKTDKVSSENVHVFELSVIDWMLIFKFSGYEIVRKKEFYQYPKPFLSLFFKPLFRRFGHVGFVAYELRPNSKFSDCYQ